MRFKVGDTVYRPSDIYKRHSPNLEGTVTRVYAKRSKLGYFYELYEVHWYKCGQKPIDKVEKGYLAQGLSGVSSVNIEYGEGKPKRR